MGALAATKNMCSHHCFSISMLSFAWHGGLRIRLIPTAKVSCKILYKALPTRGCNLVPRMSTGRPICGIADATQGQHPPIFATRTALPMRRVSHCGGRVQEVKASQKFYNNKKRLSFVCPPRFACDTHMSRTMLGQATLGNFTTLLHSASPCFLTAEAP